MTAPYEPLMPNAYVIYRSTTKGMKKKVYITQSVNLGKKVEVLGELGGNVPLGTVNKVIDYTTAFTGNKLTYHKGLVAILEGKA